LRPLAGASAFYTRNEFSGCAAGLTGRIIRDSQDYPLELLFRQARAQQHCFSHIVLSWAFGVCVVLFKPPEAKTMRLQKLLVFCSLLGMPCKFAQSKPELPKVVLAGNSIRLGYAPLVAKALEGKAIVIIAGENGGDSGNLLAHLDDWVIRAKPDIVHWNAGLHDLKFNRQTRTHQVELPQYEANLQQIAARLKKETQASLIFASTTPILDERHAGRKADFDRFESDVRRYNLAATRTLKEAGIPVNDLHWIVEKGGVAELMSADGTHYLPEGYERLAAAVTDCILRAITVRNYRPLPQPESGAEAAAIYKRDSDERDARVPAAYKNLHIKDFEIPVDERAWNDRRPGVKKVVAESLGSLPDRPSPVRARVIAREVRQGYTIERVSIENGFSGEISALLLVPENLAGARPTAAARSLLFCRWAAESLRHRRSAGFDCAPALPCFDGRVGCRLTCRRDPDSRRSCRASI
jgi:lysophospholipase L1-like esterase